MRARHTNDHKGRRLKGEKGSTGHLERKRGGRTFQGEGTGAKERHDRISRARGGRSKPKPTYPTPLPPAPTPFDASPEAGADEVEGAAKGGGKWIQKAIKRPGALHRALHVPQGEKIPAKKLAKASHSGNPRLRREVKLAETLKGMH